MVRNLLDRSYDIPPPRFLPNYGYTSSIGTLAGNIVNNDPVESILYYQLPASSFPPKYEQPYAPKYKPSKYVPRAEMTLAYVPGIGKKTIHFPKYKKALKLTHELQNEIKVKQDLKKMQLEEQDILRRRMLVDKQLNKFLLEEQAAEEQAEEQVEDHQGYNPHDEFLIREEEERNRLRRINLDMRRQMRLLEESSQQYDNDVLHLDQDKAKFYARLGRLEEAELPVNPFEALRMNNVQRVNHEVEDEERVPQLYSTNSRLSRLYSDIPNPLQQQSIAERYDIADPTKIQDAESGFSSIPTTPKKRVIKPDEQDILRRTLS